MSSHERKLLRKQIDLKLKCMANKESKENDFLSSSQLITERQQMYMTITKHSRFEDNRRSAKKIPFDIERTSLPHINLSVLNRLHETTKDVMKSPALDKVLNAHSFRTATPFYTNPELTIERGKMMNYTFHIGAILNTPRYIDFIKNSKEYIAQMKSQQKLKSEKKERYSSSDSSSSYFIKTSSESNEEDTYERSNLSVRSEFSQVSNKKSDEGTSSLYFRSSKNDSLKREDNLIKNQEMEESQVIVAYLSQSSSDIESNDERPASRPMSRSENVPKDLTTKSPKDENDRESTNVEDSSKEKNKRSDSTNEVILLKDINEGGDKTLLEVVEDFFNTTVMGKEDIALINRYFDTVDKYRFSRPEYVKDYGAHLSSDNVPFNKFHQIISSNNIQSINNDECKQIQIIIKMYKLNKSQIMKGMGHDNQSQEDITDGYIKSSDEEKEIEQEIVNMLNILSFNIQNEEKQLKIDGEISENEISDKEFNEKVKYVKSNEDDRIENASKNIINTFRRIFSMEELKQNYDIMFEKEENEDLKLNEEEDGEEEEEEEEEDDIEDEDFAECFKNLFRNSVTLMNKDDIVDLKKLINNYNSEEGNKKRLSIVETDSTDVLKKFEELFKIEKERMSSDDKNDLIKLVGNDPELYHGSNLRSFEELLKKYDYRISESDFVKIERLIMEENEKDLSPRTEEEHGRFVPS